MSRKSHSLALPLVLCVCAALSHAQAALPDSPGAATIAGTVLDADGATVPRAKVVVQGPTSGDQRSLVTEENGFFKFDGLNPGTPYKVTVTAAGFADWNSDQLVLNPGEYHLLNEIKLRVSAVQSAVSVVPDEQLALAQVKEEEQQRVLGFIPNFYVAYEQNTVPLPARLKWRLALRTMVDPIMIAGFTLNAALYQATDYPNYGHGATAFGQRVGASFADGYTNIIVGDAVLPSLLHQDPRYFYQGTGPTKSRVWHAISSAFLARADSGHTQVNYSAIGGDLAAGAMSNAYYPDRDRGAKLVVTSAAVGMGTRMLFGVLQEFLIPKFSSQKRSDDQ